MDLATYERALRRTGRAVEGVGADQLGDPTPCREWTVRDLLNHIVGGNLMFGRIAEGQTVDFDDNKPEVVGDDPAAAYRASCDALLEAWGRPGALDRVYAMPFGDVPGAAVISLHFVDTLVHGWDVAKATGQDDTIEPDLALTALGMVQPVIDDDARQGGDFGPEVVVGPDAPAHHRLMGFLGRTP